MNYLQICAFAICGLVFSIIMKNLNSSYATWIVAVVIIITAALVIAKLGGLITQIKRLLSFTEIEQSYIGLLFKIIGITYITYFTAALFRDNGHNAAASLLELFCRVSVAMLSVPIILSLFETVSKCI